MSTPSLFSQTLIAQRERLNAKFVEARHAQPALDAATFSTVLREQCAPIVNAVAQTHPNAVPVVTEALYDLALDLTGQGLLGNGARYGLMNVAWTTVLPKLARPIAEQPQRVVSAVSNGLYNLLQTPGAQAQTWLTGIEKLATINMPLDAFLQSGQVLAWRCGMAHYRDSALALCQQLPESAIQIVLSLPPHANTKSVLAQLMGNPWFRPDRPTPTSKSLRVVARVGTFRGFGGVFMAPPAITITQGQFTLKDGDQTWLLTADAFGATLHRQAESPTNPKRTENDFKLIKGVVSKPGYPSLHVAELETVTSMAGDGTTLAVTTPWSHAVTLIAGT